MTWRKLAACLAVEEKWIFDEIRHDSEDAYRAGLVCADCPVIRECYEWASREQHFEGIAAGWIWRDMKRHRGLRC